MEQEHYTCCICGKKFDGYGNNPWPICKNYYPDTRIINTCCDECNAQYVIPARMGKTLPDWIMKKFHLTVVKVESDEQILSQILTQAPAFIKELRKKAGLRQRDIIKPKSKIGLISLKAQAWIIPFMLSK